MSSIKKDLAKNTIWNSVERFSNMGIQLLCTFILARYLTPSDYGIIGMLAVFNAVANSFIDSGFGLSLIREKMVSREDYSTILYFNVVLSMVFYIALYLCSGLIADFYNQPILVDLSKVVFLMLPFHIIIYNFCNCCYYFCIYLWECVGFSNPNGIESVPAIVVSVDINRFCTYIKILKGQFC